jgi:hypothetical protein
VSAPYFVTSGFYGGHDASTRATVTAFFSFQDGFQASISFTVFYGSADAGVVSVHEFFGTSHQSCLNAVSGVRSRFFFGGFTGRVAGFVTVSVAVGVVSALFDRTPGVVFFDVIHVFFVHVVDAFTHVFIPASASKSHVTD